MADPTAALARQGFVVFDADPRVAEWVRAARAPAIAATQDPALQARWLRHGRTWFVGVDALANSPDGSIGGVPFRGPWEDLVPRPEKWHRAQLSVTYPGYPQMDQGESDAAHRFRVARCAAHVDGLHLEDGRRIVREVHGFILGLPLTDSDACPLVVWQGSHLSMRRCLSGAIAEGSVIGADVTAAYKSERARIYDTIKPVEVAMRPGQSVLLDRHVLHGVAPWRDTMTCPEEGRMVAYFRPELENADDWLRG